MPFGGASEKRNWRCLSPFLLARRNSLTVRGIKYQGQLYRLPIKFLAAEGESFELEVTAFIPHLEPGQEWLFPSFLGLQGCLEFLRFAVDPGANVFYFGPS